MTYDDVITELKSYSNKTIQNIFENHGAKGQSWGVKIGDLKKIQKKIKKDHALSLQLFDSGIGDAQYLAGLIADEAKITKTQLQHWAKSASGQMISEYTVPWIAAESRYGWELSNDWINEKEESIISAGWNTLASLVAIKRDEDLNTATLKKLMVRVETDIAGAPNRVRYAMNGFVIAVGCYVKSLSNDALKTGETLGKVQVDMAGTACKVPYAPDYIKKVMEKGTVGKKKKMARC